MAATDKEGRTACLMQSLFHDFGSGCMIGDTGILWSNRAAGFNPNPMHPNAWAPGRRPANTLNPSCYLADNGQQMFFGSQGGDGQPQTQLVLATQLVDFQQSIEEALNAPRFLLGRSFFDSADNLKLEANIDSHVKSQLAQLGHDIEIIPTLSPYTGLAGVVGVHVNGQVSAMHDPRGQGNAIAL
jgi:gamma-glutamyltranspeptidase/glutathione hydrolase